MRTAYSRTGTGIVNTRHGQNVVRQYNKIVDWLKNLVILFPPRLAHQIRARGIRKISLYLFYSLLDFTLLYDYMPLLYMQI